MYRERDITAKTLCEFLQKLNSMQVCFHDGVVFLCFEMLHSAPEKETCRVFFLLLHFSRGRAASCQEPLCCPLCSASRARSLSASFKHWCTWSLVLCRNSWHPRARAQWACSAPPCRGRKLVYIRVIPGIASMSAQSTCSRLWGKPVWLCPRKCASCFSFFTPF